jgi:FkbM family methyltransferase
MQRKQIVGLVRTWLTPFVPIARAWIRYSPLSLGKALLFRVFWRCPHQFTVRTKHGFVLAGRSSDVVQGFVYYFGTWEPDITSFLRNRLREFPNGVFIDVGANVGYYTALAATVMAKDARIVAIEAQSETLRMLQRNVEINGFKNVVCLHAAVTDSEKEVRVFSAPSWNVGSTTIIESRFPNASTELVRGSSLGGLIEHDLLARCNTVKIDVEGAEAMVVRGLEAALMKMPQELCFVIEIATDEVEAANYIFTFFIERGFRALALYNSYDSGSYLRKRPLSSPVEIFECPTEQTDVLFLRTAQPSSNLPSFGGASISA